MGNPINPNTNKMSEDGKYIITAGSRPMKFRIANEGDEDVASGCLNGYEVYTPYFFGGSQAQKAFEGTDFVPLCAKYGQTNHPDSNTLVAFQTDKAEAIKIAARNGHTSAAKMDCYILKRKEHPPITEDTKEIFDKMQVALPILGKITGYTENLSGWKEEPAASEVVANTAPHKEPAPPVSIEQFEQTHAMDAAKLQELIQTAMAGESLNGFAKRCGINYSTFYYITKGKTRGPVKLDLLKKIAEAAAPHADISFSDLAHANGYSYCAGGKKKEKTNKPTAKAPRAKKQTRGKKPIEKASAAETAAGPICFNVFEVLTRPSDGYLEERYVCSFESEDDAKDFAERHSQRNKYAVRPAFFVSHKAYDKKMDRYSLLAAQTAPKVKDPQKAGYDIFATTSCSTIIPGALHIEKLDGVNRFSDDYAAARQAQRDGIKLIDDMDGVEGDTYIDTPENRALIASTLHLYPECDTRNWRRRGSNQ